MATSATNDTSDDARRVQIALLREATPDRRAALACSLSSTVIELSRRALRQRWPEASEREIRLRWLALQYGDSLAERVRAYLAKSEP